MNSENQIPAIPTMEQTTDNVLAVIRTQMRPDCSMTLLYHKNFLIYQDTLFEAVNVLHSQHQECQVEFAHLPSLLALLGISPETLPRVLACLQDIREVHNTLLSDFVAHQQANPPTIQLSEI